MNLREAAQQALDALIWTTGSEDFSENGKAREGALNLLFPAITALRAALSEDVPETNFGNITQKVDSKESDHVADTGKTSDQSEDARGMVATSRESRQVEPVATINEMETVEPVAWIRRLEWGIEYGPHHKAAFKLPDGVRFDLYTAPPKRKPLTPEEIQECVAEVDDARLAGPITALIRAVERKLGIGGEE